MGAAIEEGPGGLQPFDLEGPSVPAKAPFRLPEQDIQQEDRKQQEQEQQDAQQGEDYMEPRRLLSRRVVRGEGLTIIYHAHDQVDKNRLEGSTQQTL